LDTAGCIDHRHAEQDARTVVFQHLLAILMATIGKHRNLVRTGGGERRLPHRR